MELYNVSYSTCSQKVRLCLAEKELIFKDRRLDFTKNEHLDKDYLKLNPNGVVPTLVDRGRPVIESSVICEYLDERYPSPALMPVDVHDRARVRAWMRYIDEVPTASIRIPSFNQLFSPVLSQWSQEKLEEEARLRPVRKHLYLKLREGRFSEEEYDASIERLSQTVERVESSLADHTWLAGEQFTLADLLLTPLMVRMEDTGLSSLWAEMPCTADWYERVQLRPSFQVAFYPGSRIGPLGQDGRPLSLNGLERETDSNSY